MRSMSAEPAALIATAVTASVAACSAIASDQVARGGLQSPHQEVANQRSTADRHCQCRRRAPHRFLSPGTAGGHPIVRCKKATLGSAFAAKCGDPVH